MPDLYEAIAGRVDAWRADGYPHEAFPAVAEVLQFAIDDEASGHLRYLRAAQFRALETYWHLRLVEGTPRIPELYKRLFGRNTERLAALGLTAPELQAIVTDDGYTTTRRTTSTRLRRLISMSRSSAH